MKFIAWVVPLMCPRIVLQVVFIGVVVILSGHYSKVFTVSTIAVVSHQGNWCGH